jgi:uncharacterized OB-fold protein
MTVVSAVGAYQPAWADAGRRTPGPDEDVITMAVAAGRAALAVVPGAAVTRVVLVARDPGYLDGLALPVLTRALAAGAAATSATAGLPAEVRAGGAPAAVDALSSAAPGTLIIGVDLGPQAGAAAALIAGPAGAGAQLTEPAVAARSLPMRVRATGQARPAIYADPRAERELGWRPVLEALAGAEGKPVVTGIPAGDAARLGGRAPGSLAGGERAGGSGRERAGGTAAELPGGAAGPLFALAAMAGQDQTARLIGLDAGTGAAVTVSRAGQLQAACELRPSLPAGARPAVAGEPIVIPLSMPAYERAIDAKIGLIAQRCRVCGTESYPKRVLCLGCGEYDSTEPFPLPHRGEVYSSVTVHVPVPGVPTPRGLAVVALPPTGVRVLAHVTDALPHDSPIGTAGELVLRLVAIRQGIPDYGYGFRPDLLTGDAPDTNGAS